MGTTRQARRALRRLIVGPWDFPQQCTVGLRDPQTEVAVWLRGLGAPRDVTHSHLMACGAPFTIGIGFDREQTAAVESGTRLSLTFHERCGEQRLLGKIGLRRSESLSVGTQQLCLFRVRHYGNYCLSKPRLWARYLQYACLRRRVKDSDVPITAREIHAMIVFYICPRPVVLASVADGGMGTVFPMNLMGPIGNGYFAFALNSTKAVAPLVERTGKVALSCVPVEQAPLAYQLAANHKKPCFEWDQLSFATTRSTALGVPVPRFALRVREMEVQATRKVGSHTLFVARTIQDERWADGLQFFVVHGIYQTWRQQMKRALPAFPGAG